MPDLARLMLAAVLAAVVGLSGCGAAGSEPAASTLAAAWLASPGGQAQVTLNQDVDTLASTLYIEERSPTVANHKAFEAAARTVRTQATTILASRNLLPAVDRTAYVTMLADFITVASLLQPGPLYGTVAQDHAAWNAALHASDIPNSCGC